MRTLAPVLLASSLFFAGCSTEKPLQPVSSASTLARAAAVSSNAAAPMTVSAAAMAARANPGSPGYEPAYVNGSTVTINAIEVPNRAPSRAQADFYEVVYPDGWASLGLAPPMCNPCDHDGNGIDALDFHDHILDSAPAIPGHGEYSPLWHVYVVVPAYSGDATHDAAVTAAYAPHIPTTSEAAVDALLGSHLTDGSPVAVEIDTQFYFLCAVVNSHASR